mmetsp:Transcript_21554/g.54366  ORF Transcript_21554/g.54366 Transcript_21554/m.54366 type:complete len:244 (+) Transcript_21554:2457-3188(+)
MLHHPGTNPLKRTGGGFCLAHCIIPFSGLSSHPRLHFHLKLSEDFVDELHEIMLAPGGLRGVERSRPLVAELGWQPVVRHQLHDIVCSLHEARNALQRQKFCIFFCVSVFVGVGAVRHECTVIRSVFPFVQSFQPLHDVLMVLRSIFGHPRYHPRHTVQIRDRASVIAGTLTRIDEQSPHKRAETVRRVGPGATGVVGPPAFERYLPHTRLQHVDSRSGTFPQIARLVGTPPVANAALCAKTV